VCLSFQVLQSLADGLISATVKPQDLQCSFFRHTARELLACAVLRPVVNLANPRFINERVESLALSRASNAEKGVAESLEDATTVKPKEPPMPCIDEFSALIDHSSPGVELVRFHQVQSKTASDIQPSKSEDPPGKLESPNISLISNSHPLESTSLLPRSHTATDNGFPSNHKDSDQAARDNYGRERAPYLGISSQHKRQALAPEHLENMWTKGKNYKLENIKHGAKVPSLGSTPSVQHSVPSGTSIRQHPIIPQRQTDFSYSEDQHLIRHSATPTYSNGTNHLHKSLSAETTGHASPEEFGVESDSSYSTEDDESNNVTGLDSPVTRVWDSKSKGNATSSHIHHPLESSGFNKTKKNRSHVGKLKISSTSSGRKRSRSNALKTPAWQEERSSLLVEDDSDILNSSANDSRMNELFDDTKVESMARMFSSANASSLSLASTDSSYSSNYCGANVLEDSYLKLRCEVLYFHLIYIVKSGSGMYFYLIYIGFFINSGCRS
jgi:sorting nexin-13